MTTSNKPPLQELKAKPAQNGSGQEQEA